MLAQNQEARPLGATDPFPRDHLRFLLRSHLALQGRFVYRNYVFTFRTLTGFSQIANFIRIPWNSYVDETSKYM